MNLTHRTTSWLYATAGAAFAFLATSCALQHAWTWTAICASAALLLANVSYEEQQAARRARDEAVRAELLARAPLMVLPSNGPRVQPLIRRTPDQLQAQRARLLAEAGLTYEELADRAAAWQLSPEQLDIWHTIEGIDWLLDGEQTTSGNTAEEKTQ